jgi:hypothetical protein
VPAPEELEDEDLLEMANAGLVEVLSSTITRRGSGSASGRAETVSHVALRTGGEIAWAIRKNSPGCSSREQFLALNGRDSLNARMIFRRYLLNTQYVKGRRPPTNGSARSSPCS